MQISFHTKRRHFVFLTGVDAEPGSDNEPETFVSVQSADLSLAPTGPEVYYEEEEEGRHSFGVSPVSPSNARLSGPKPGV